METVALAFTLGFLMSSQGIDYQHWAFWCYLGLFWVYGVYQHFQGSLYGVKIGIDEIMRLRQEVENYKKKVLK